MNSLQIGGHTFDWGTRTFVMGILNVTPDSFSGDGLLAPPHPQPLPKSKNDLERGAGVEAALEQARRFVLAGADILDVGGKSTRPGSEPLGIDEERGRVIPVVKALSEEFPNSLISIDTYKSVIAEEALGAGAQIVNDVWALRADPQTPRGRRRGKVPGDPDAQPQQSRQRGGPRSTRKSVYRRRI